MDKLYELNPNARMAFCLSSSFSYLEGKAALNRIASLWNIPIIDLWGEMNTSPKSLIKLKSKNGTDSHLSTFAHEIMGRKLSGKLLTTAE